MTQKFGNTSAALKMVHRMLKKNTYKQTTLRSHTEHGAWQNTPGRMVVCKVTVTCIPISRIANYSARCQKTKSSKNFPQQHLIHHGTESLNIDRPIRWTSASRCSHPYSKNPDGQPEPWSPAGRCPFPIHFFDHRKETGPGESSLGRTNDEISRPGRPVLHPGPQCRWKIIVRFCLPIIVQE